MTDRTVSVVLQAKINDYLAKMSTAGKATSDFAHTVDTAKGKAAQGYHMLGVAGVAMGTAVAGGYALAVKSAADFEAKMALVRTLAHATTSEMSQLSNAAKTVGQAYGFSANEVADAEAELVKAGVSVADIMGGALKGALTLASAGQTDVATATTIAATAMTQFALKGKDVPHIADLLSAGADKALGSVVDLGYALDQAGPTAHQFGVSLEQTVGTLAAFAQSGQIGERGGTIFQQMLLKLAAPGKQASQILKNLGVTLYDTNGQFVGMASLAGQLQTKMAGLTQAERNHDLSVIFGARAIRGANILYQEGAKGIEDWTKKVNAAGFAELQSAGKMDSLTGDVKKLGTELKVAFIGAGEGAQGPLRTMTQDVTQAVHVWNELPGPVKDASEALVLAGGAVTLAGGAALLFIPKWTAMNAALVATGRNAISARAALGGLGKLTTVGTVLFGVAEGIHAVTDALAGSHAPDVDKLTAALVDFGQTSKVSGELSKAFGANMKDFSGELKRIVDPGVNKRIQDVGATIFSLGGRVADLHSDLTGAHKDFNSLDDALAGLVQRGHADIAQQIFTQFGEKARAAGVSTDKFASLLPHYGKALLNLRTDSKLAADGQDRMAGATAGAAGKTRDATKAAKHYSDQLHALADPLFAMNQALQGVVDAQAEATHATHKFGAESAQARQANLDLASAALDAEAAARTLAASVEQGSVSIGAARKFLKQWVADGLLTKDQADNVVASFDHLIGRAQTISGLHPHMTVTTDTSQAEQALSNLLVHIGQVINGFFNIDSTAAVTTHPGLGDFNLPARTHGGGRPTSSDSGLYTPTGSDSGLYTPGGGSGGGGRAGGGHKERPPTVQEIVNAILHGTIPPAIDKLSKTLQTEIRHLSSTVGSAQQYRSSVRTSLLGYASLSGNTGGTDSFGSSMGPQKVNSYLKGRLSQLRQFVHLRQRLENQGAGAGLLGEFDAIGPEANQEMKQLLAGGKHAIHRANTLERRIHHLAGVAAGAAATDKYGPQIVHLLQKAPHEEARLIAKALRHQHIYVNLHHHDRAQGKHVRQHG